MWCLCSAAVCSCSHVLSDRKYQGHYKGQGDKICNHNLFTPYNLWQKKTASASRFLNNHETALWGRVLLVFRKIRNWSECGFFFCVWVAAIGELFGRVLVSRQPNDNELWLMRSCLLAGFPGPMVLATAEQQGAGGLPDADRPVLEGPATRHWCSLWEIGWEICVLQRYAWRFFFLHPPAPWSIKARF